MRTVVNISLPVELNKVVERAVKKRGFASKSEFFRDLLRLWQLEDGLLSEVKKSEREFARGKGRILRSFKDLR